MGAKVQPRTHLYPSTRVVAFLIDETMIQIGHNEAWLWVAVEPVYVVQYFVCVHLKTQEYDSS
jgi:transposase-like protein